MASGGSAVEVVKEFKYLGSLVEATGRMTGEVDRCVVKASKAFSSLHSAAFMAHDLTKRWCIILWCWECYYMVQ